MCLWTSFEEKEMKKIRSIKNSWYDLVINYIPEPSWKKVDGFKDKVISLFKANTPKKTVYGREKKLSRSKAHTHTHTHTHTQTIWRWLL